MNEPAYEKQILVAGVGNAWLQDDAFGGEVARRLEREGVPSGVTVMDFGTSGLDLAYEVMRGYDALVLIDASRQGEQPGTLFVIEPRREEFAGSIEDGEMIDPHGMDPHTVLRFVNATGGWPGVGGTSSQSAPTRVKAIVRQSIARIAASISGPLPNAIAMSVPLASGATSCGASAIAGSARLPTMTGCTNSTATWRASDHATGPAAKASSRPPWAKRWAIA